MFNVGQLACLFAFLKETEQQVTRLAGAIYEWQTADSIADYAQGSGPSPEIIWAEDEERLNAVLRLGDADLPQVVAKANQEIRESAAALANLPTRLRGALGSCSVEDDKITSVLAKVEQVCREIDERLTTGKIVANERIQAELVGVFRFMNRHWSDFLARFPSPMREEALALVARRTSGQFDSHDLAGFAPELAAEHPSSALAPKERLAWLCEYLRNQLLTAKCERHGPYWIAPATNLAKAAVREMRSLGGPNLVQEPSAVATIGDEFDAVVEVLSDVVSWCRAPQDTSGNGGGSAGKEPRKRSVNSKMIDLVQKTEEVKYWSAKKLSAVLGCSPSTVKGTATWAGFQKIREDDRKAAGERCEKRGHGKNHPR